MEYTHQPVRQDWHKTDFTSTPVVSLELTKPELEILAQCIAAEVQSLFRKERTHYVQNQLFRLEYLGTMIDEVLNG